MTTPVLPLLERISGRVAVLGSLNADLTVQTERLPGPGETVTGSDLHVLPGGKSANQAAAAALLGADVHMIGAVGTDANGQLLLDTLREAGASTASVERIDVPTGTAVISVDAAGENTIIVSPGANGTLSPATADAHADVIRSSRALGLCLEVSIDAVTRAALIAHEAGVPVVLNVSPFRADLPEELVRATDVLIVNEHELTGLLAHHCIDADTWEERAAALAGLGIPRAVVTLGGRGSVVLQHSSIDEVEPVAVEVVDTTGAGDSFAGTLLAGLASGVDLVDSARLASLVSAHATTTLGAQASYADAQTLRRLYADK